MTPDGDAGGRARTALVTRGTGGMGRVIAAKLAADGFDVVVAYVGNVDLADAAGTRTENCGPEQDDLDDVDVSVQPARA